VTLSDKHTSNSDSLPFTSNVISPLPGSNVDSLSPRPTRFSINCFTSDCLRQMDPSFDWAVHDYPVFTLPTHMALHRLPERSYVRSLRSTVSVSTLWRLKLSIPLHLHTPPSFPPILLGPISSPLHYNSRPTPPSLSPRPFFTSVVRAAPYPLTTTNPLLLPTFRTSTVDALTAHFARVTMHTLFAILSRPWKIRVDLPSFVWFF
jgi:hypothetical protein